MGRKGPKPRTAEQIRALLEALPRDENGCWIYGGASYNGYGMIHFEGRQTYAHRLAWQIFRGPIPKHDSHRGTMVVAHRCDQPRCCNPEHLFVGSQADNVADMHAKGRGPTKEQLRTFGNARLSVDEVLLIRRLYDESDLSEEKIGAMFGIEQTTVSAIGRRKTWSRLPEESP